MMTPDEQEVLQEKLFENYDKLERYALYLCYNHLQNAQDLMQATVEDILTAKEVKNIANLHEGWFLKVMKNRFLMTVRKENQAPQVPSEVYEDDKPFFQQRIHNPEELVVTMITVQEVRNHIGEDEFTAIGLKSLGYTAQEVATLTSSTRRAVENKVKMACKHGKQVLMTK